MTVKAILDEKGTHVHTVQPNVTIGDAIKRFMVEEIGALVVSRDGKKVDGMISERDVVLGIANLGDRVLDLSVSFLMTRDVLTCAPEDRIAHIMATMAANRVRHLPVVKDGELRGLISIGDVVAARLEEVEADAKSMRSYISGVALTSEEVPATDRH